VDIDSSETDGVSTGTRQHRLRLELFGIYELRWVFDLLAGEVCFAR